ncbi:MAG: sulfite exporter TauE/SafE family protein [Bacteroidales bacterium]|nr:sulfite exporter TauE/SafE family protein [Bacteroidales bacterium]
MTEPIWIYVPLFAAAFMAGIMNAVAGGGTLITFPTLIAALAMFGDEAAAIANATSTLALLPGSLAGAWGYRAELATNRRFVVRMIGPSIAGGLIGSLLLAGYPEAFEALVPWLVLSAAILFLIQPPLVRLVRRWQNSEEPGTGLLVGLMVFQFFVAVYGGYFGAGIGILMLTALGFMGVGNIHHMNGIKTVLAGAINAVTVVVVVAAGMIYWPYAGVMAVASILGGYAGARVARRLPPVVVRVVVVVIGFGLAAYYFAG